MHAEITFPLHAQRGAAYLTAPNIPARHAFSTRLGGVSTGVLESLNLSVRRGDTPENVRENWRRRCRRARPHARGLCKAGAQRGCAHRARCRRAAAGA